VGQGPEPAEAPKEGDVVKSQLPEAFLSPEGGKPSEPNPMEVDVPDPQGGSEPFSARCTTLMKSYMMPRQDT
jgi:hypothetical protein